ncbi:apolipoprotein Ea [Rhinichthys klamathensis goyatoka]|uniref:apolipoprotein Ea n=1 Tax=Rhinichthys klamathensis goyatoka TaxID=3034132 RepID=UPI0024B494A7|nr:apolipoprotein Ea [Rhinichthys klamathensis goyatoka]
MKFVAVILALAVISGCQGNFLFQDEPKSPWEKAVDQFWNRVSELTSRAEEMRDNIKATQLGRELDTLIGDTMTELQMYKDDMHSKLGPYAQETAERFNEDLQLLTSKLRTHMEDAKDRVTEYSQELRTMVEQNAEDVKNRVNTYAKKLRKRFNKDIQEINKKMETYFEEVRSRAAQNMEDVKGRLEPYFTAMQQRAEDKLISLGELLRSQGEGIKEKLESQMQGLREQVEKTTENMGNTLQEKADELHKWFEPYFSQFQKQLGY